MNECVAGLPVALVVSLKFHAKLNGAVPPENVDVKVTRGRFSGLGLNTQYKSLLSGTYFVYPELFQDSVVFPVLPPSNNTKESGQRPSAIQKINDVNTITSEDPKPKNTRPSEPPRFALV